MVFKNRVLAVSVSFVFLLGLCLLSVSIHPGNIPSPEPYSLVELPAGFRPGNYRTPKAVTEKEKPSIDMQVAQLLDGRRNGQEFKKSDSLPCWPVVGVKPSISGYFSEMRGERQHQAIDIAVPVGTPVVAVFKGKLYKGNQGGLGLGKYVYVVHDNSLITYYGHLNDWAPIDDGTFVHAGTVIGWSGNTGKSTGPHLHFAVKGAGGFINPLDILHYSGAINMPAINKY